MFRFVGVAVGVVALLLASVVGGVGGPAIMAHPGFSAGAAAASYSGVMGYVDANTNGYSPIVPLASATVTILSDCTSLVNMTCTTVGTTSTNATGFFGMNLPSGPGYFAVVERLATPMTSAPNGFGGAIQEFTAPVTVPIVVNVYPFVPYGNATLDLPAYNCLGLYLDNSAGGGPGCENPVLSWTQDGAFYINTSDELVFYSFVNRTVYPLTPFVPLVQTFPSYAMIPNELFITQDGAYIYSWGQLNSSSTSITVEAVNVTTHHVFFYNFTTDTIADVTNAGEVLLTGWDGNDSQVVLIDQYGDVYDHDLWEAGETLVGGLPFFEANNIYWVPFLNAFINVEADGSDYDYVEELQMTGPADTPAEYSLTQTYLETWTGAAVTVNGVDGMSFNVSNRELSFEPENTGVTYQVLPNGVLSNLLVVSDLYRDSSFNITPVGSTSESDRPALTTSGPYLAGNYNGYVNDSWLISMTAGHLGYYTTNVSPDLSRAETVPTQRSYLSWYQEGQFVNTSYMISPQSYSCDASFLGPCTINGGSGAPVGTIWWLWRLGMPEFPYSPNSPIADASSPPAVTVTGVTTTATNATVHWTPIPNDTLLNYTLAWGTSSSDLNNRVSVDGSADSYTIQGLASSSHFYVEVAAWNLHYQGANSAVVGFETALGAKDLDVTASSVTNVSLAWTNPPANLFTNITVNYGTSPAALSKHLSAGAVDSYTVNGLAPSTTYYFSVTAWNGTSEGVPSNMVNGTTSFVGPRDLTLAGLSVDFVDLKWANPASGTFTNVTVEYGLFPGPLTSHVSIGIATSYSVSALKPETTYAFALVAWNRSTESTPSNTVNATTLFPGVTNLAVVSVTTTNATLTWVNPSPGTYTNLTVEYGTSPSDLSDHLSVGLVSAITVANLSSSTTYYFEVVAWNGSHPGNPSNVAAGTTLAGPTSSSSMLLEELLLGAVVALVIVVGVLIWTRRKKPTPPPPPGIAGPPGTSP